MFRGYGIMCPWDVIDYCDRLIADRLKMLIREIESMVELNCEKVVDFK